MLARNVRVGPYASSASNLCSSALALAGKVFVGPSGCVDIAAPRLAALNAIQQLPDAARNNLVTELIRQGKSGSPSSITYHELSENSPTGTIAYALAEFKNKCSRNLGVLRLDLLQSTISSVVPSCGDVFLTVIVQSKDQVLPAAVGVARSFGKYTRKTTAKTKNVTYSRSNHTGSHSKNDNISNTLPLNAETSALASTESRSTIIPELDRDIYVDIVTLTDDLTESDYKELQTIVDCIRQCRAHTDMPCSEINCDSFVMEAKAAVERIQSFPCNESADINIRVFQGDELTRNGFGGLSAVGRAATSPPALCILSREVKSSSSSSNVDPFNIALVGKGIMFDTGGLSIKPTQNMCGMKHDMAGAASVLAAFEAICRHPPTERPLNVYAILCVAENAIGPLAYRNDDIIQMYSGLTVEINNTDAEGRLVLADGVAYASRHIPNLNAIVTIATLTGAQPIATGLSHAGILASTPEIEAAVLSAGLQTGELAFPLLYAPELLSKSTFDSKFADMKNSVLDRSNAPSSAAGHFIERHLCDPFRGAFLHIDIAGPSAHKHCATGHGTTLLYKLLHILTGSS